MIKGLFHVLLKSYIFKNSILDKITSLRDEKKVGVLNYIYSISPRKTKIYLQMKFGTKMY